MKRGAILGFDVGDGWPYHTLPFTATLVKLCAKGDPIPAKL
jgi:hypothetical protein